MSRIGTGLVLFALTPAMETLVALGKYPLAEDPKLIIGLLAAPAIVYGLNSFGRVRNDLYDKLEQRKSKLRQPQSLKKQRLRPTLLQVQSLP